MSTEIHPVDQILPAPRLLALGLQHVLVMYAGAVAVPLIIGRALKLPPEDVAFLISADLFACGLATLVQCIGFPGVGIRLPVMMGVTFASVGPMLSMAAAPDIGLLGIYGSIIAAGIFGILAAPFISRLLPLFPPVVTGAIILVIGISLMRVGINWAGGGLPTRSSTAWAPRPPRKRMRRRLLPRRSMCEPRSVLIQRSIATRCVSKDGCARGFMVRDARKDALLTMRNEISTSTVRRIAPGRNQKRHVEMAFGLAHRKP